MFSEIFVRQSLDDVRFSVSIKKALARLYQDKISFGTSVINSDRSLQLIRQHDWV